LSVFISLSFATHFAKKEKRKDEKRCKSQLKREDAREKQMDGNIFQRKIEDVEIKCNRRE
jgi:hypothetical protein